MPIPYYHVDAFTGELFAGNPAGVCMLSDFLADSTMRKIAAENRHSQTAFVVPRADGDFDLRWFTPKVEDDLCGHATLASAYVLALRKHNVWPVRFHTCSGMLTVAQDQDGFEMDFPARPPQPCETPVDLLPALGLKAALVMKLRDYLVVVVNCSWADVGPFLDELLKLSVHDSSMQDCKLEESHLVSWLDAPSTVPVQDWTNDLHADTQLAT